MSYDFRLLDYIGEAAVSKVERGADSLLHIEGSGFTPTSFVVVDGIQTDTTLVRSKSKLLTVLPPSLAKSPISSVRVFNRTPTVSPNAVQVSFTASRVNGRINGFDFLMQFFLKILLTNRGEDLHNPELGGNLRTLVGSAGDVGALRARAIVSIRDTEQQIIALQAGRETPATERLKSARLVGANFSSSRTELAVQLALENLAGDTGSSQFLV